MDVDEYRSDLLEQVKIGASANLRLDPEEFVDMVVNELMSSDECSDFTPCYYSGETRRGKKMEIFGYDLDEFNTLSVFAAKYNGTASPEKLSRSDFVKIAERAVAFVNESLQGTVQLLIDESNPARDFADLIYSQRKYIEKFKVYVITDNHKSDRIKHIEIEDINEKETTIYLWDIDNLYDLVISKGGYDDHIISLSDFGVEGIPCLKASLGSLSRYDSYLCAVPGQLLCDLFKAYRGKLLESNVRSYLKTSKKNKEIKGTIINNPDMFFAYNNGITATAIGVTLEEFNGVPTITQFNSLQIVNGGQTTVSIFDVFSKDGADLSQVYVPMKLTIIPGDEQEDIVPIISRAANTQNTVSNADFFSNHPFHKKMHQISVKTRAPIAPGMPFASKWYYESARGQYAQQQLALCKLELDKFKMEYPKTQLITKTDLAKYRVSYEGLPNIVSKGREDAFKHFASQISSKYESEPDFINEVYFKESVSIAIIYRQLEKLIPRQDWFEKGYRSQIINYTIAKIVFMLEQHNMALDLAQIWERQSLSPELSEQLLLVAKRVQQSFNEDKQEANIAQWCKKPACWEAVKRIDIDFTSGIQKCVISEKKSKWASKVATRAEKNTRNMNSQIEVVNLGYSYWKEVYEWALEHNAVDGREKDFLRLALKLEYNKYPSDKQCTVIIQIRDKLREYGMKK